MDLYQIKFGHVVTRHLNKNTLKLLFSQNKVMKLR